MTRLDVIVNRLYHDSVPFYGFTESVLRMMVRHEMIDERIAVLPEYPYSEARYNTIQEWEDDNHYDFEEHIRNKWAEGS
jgi:hypothetical protein